MLTRDRRTPATDHAAPAPRPGRAQARTVLHRDGATVEVRYAGSDCVSVLVTTSLRTAAGRGPGGQLPVDVDPGRDAGDPPHVNPYARAVLEAAATAPDRLLDALTDRLGTEVAGVSLDRSGGQSLVTIDLLPTRTRVSAWPRAGWSSGSRTPVDRRQPAGAGA